MKNIHLLPTPNPSRLFKDDFGKLFYSINIDQEQDHFKPQNIYITNDEEIKEGDWFIELDLKGTRSSYINKPYLCDIGNTGGFILTKNSGNFPFPENCKKIILTDNEDLIQDGVQAIDDEFLKWFVKNPSCEYVPIQPDKVYNKNRDSISYYKIIIPEEIGFKVENGKRTETFYSKEEPKQETLKEAALIYASKPRKFGTSMTFIDGAKWQEEQTIEEVFEWLTTQNYLTDLKETLIENFKEFKNK